MSRLSLQKYYGPKGVYLRDHKKYFTQKILHRDVKYIIDTLKLNKKDLCLDLQCADGRITVELNKRGYRVDGIDRSAYMLRLARRKAREEHVDIKFFKQNLHTLHVTGEYDRIFLFFPDHTNLDLSKVLKGVRASLKTGGLFLYDHDSEYRILNWLKKHPKTEFYFDVVNKQLKSKKDDQWDQYYTSAELKEIFLKHGFKIINVFGGWNQDDKYAPTSPRLRIVAKKI